MIYPSIPGAEDLALLIQAAVAAPTSGLGIWASAETLLAYEYRAMEKLFQITRKKVNIRRGVHVRAMSPPVLTLKPPEPLS